MLYYNVVKRMRSVLFLILRIYCFFFLMSYYITEALGKNAYFLFHQDLEFVLHLLDDPCYISQIHYMLTPFCLKLCLVERHEGKLHVTVCFCLSLFRGCFMCFNPIACEFEIVTTIKCHSWFVFCFLTFLTLLSTLLLMRLFF